MIRSILVILITFSVYVGCCKCGSNECIIDYRDSLVGIYGNGIARYYSCWNDTHYTGVYDVEIEYYTHVEIQKLGNSGLRFIEVGGFAGKEILNVGVLTKAQVDTGGPYANNGEIFYAFVNKDSVCLRKGKLVFGKSCSYPLSETIATKK